MYILATYVVLPEICPENSKSEREGVVQTICRKISRQGCGGFRVGWPV